MIFIGFVSICINAMRCIDPDQHARRLFAAESIAVSDRIRNTRVTMPSQALRTNYREIHLTMQKLSEQLTSEDRQLPLWNILVTIGDLLKSRRQTLRRLDDLQAIRHRHWSIGFVLDCCVESAEHQLSAFISSRQLLIRAIADDTPVNPAQIRSELRQTLIENQTSLHMELQLLIDLVSQVVANNGSTTSAQ
jgi:hypothetical protein